MDRIQLRLKLPALDMKEAKISSSSSLVVDVESFSESFAACKSTLDSLALGQRT